MNLNRLEVHKIVGNDFESQSEPENYCSQVKYMDVFYKSSRPDHFINKYQ